METACFNRSVVCLIQTLLPLLLLVYFFPIPFPPLVPSLPGPLLPAEASPSTIRAPKPALARIRLAEEREVRPRDHPPPPPRAVGAPEAACPGDAAGAGTEHDHSAICPRIVAAGRRDGG